MAPETGAAPGTAGENPRTTFRATRGSQPPSSPGASVCYRTLSLGLWSLQETSQDYTSPLHPGPHRDPSRSLLAKAHSHSQGDPSRQGEGGRRAPVLEGSAGVCCHGNILLFLLPGSLSSGLSQAEGPALRRKHLSPPGSLLGIDVEIMRTKQNRTKPNQTWLPGN